MNNALVIEKPGQHPPIVTIVGEEGVAKTSTAATWPNPIFIRAEDGMQCFSDADMPDAFQVVKKADDIINQITYLLKSEHDYRTLVIDSISALDKLFTAHILATSPRDEKTGQPHESMNSVLGGFGRGHEKLAHMHDRVRAGCELLNKKRGMAIVFIAHSNTRNIELPDGDPYTKWVMDLPQKCQAPYVREADLVGFIKLEVFTRRYKSSDSKNKAVSDGTLVMICHKSASNISKNRYGITEPIPMPQGKNPLRALIPALELMYTSTTEQK